MGSITTAITFNLDDSEETALGIVPTSMTTITLMPPSSITFKGPCREDPYVASVQMVTKWDRALIPISFHFD